MKQFLKIIIIVFLNCVACTEQIRQKDLGDNEANSTTTNEKENSDVSGNSQEFVLVTASGSFEKHANISEGVVYNILLKIKNSTPNKIHSINFTSCIEAIFNNDERKVKFYPDPFTDESEDDYLNSPIANQMGGSNNCNKEIKWLPGEEKNIELTVFKEYNLNWGRVGFTKDLFEKTPTEVYFVYKYKFIGIDGEYGDIVRVDIMNSWKDYQTELNLR